MNECILVVDDDPEIVGAIAITLEREGYRVLRAYNGMEALDLALDPAVRLILIDVMMPKLDGLSALLRIREKRNLPVIVLSAKSEDTDKILGLSMGADDYVTKPSTPKELAARVWSQLRRYTLLGDVHAEARQGLLVNGRLTYDPARRELRADGGDGEAHRHGDQDRGSADAQSRPHLPGGGDLPPGVGRGGGLRLRKHGDGPHPPHSGKDRTQSQESQITSRWCGELDTKMEQHGT